MDKGRDWEIATIWEIRDMQTAPTPSHYSWKLETKLTFELMMQIFYIRIGHALKAGKFSNIFKHLKLIISYWIWCFVFLSGKYCVFLYSLCRIVFLGVSKLLWKKQDVIAQELWIKRFFYTILIMRRSRYPFQFHIHFLTLQKENAMHPSSPTQNGRFSRLVTNCTYRFQ